MKDTADALKVKEGAELALLLQQPGGQQLLTILMAKLGDYIERILTVPMSDEHLVQQLHEARGLMRVLSGMGEKIHTANRLAVRRATKSVLRQQGEED